MENNGKAYADMYITFEALEDGTFSVKKKGVGVDIQYSIDNGATWASLMQFETVSVAAGNTVMWKSNITTDDSSGIGQFFSTCRFKAYGNTMSLIYGDDFKGKTSLNGKNEIFYGLFCKCLLLTEASNLILPATELTHQCYMWMFKNCKNLTTAPELPALELADGCYYGMFEDCSGLTTAPELPATKASYWCYAFMFDHCTSLTKAPELPATTLDRHCYYCMFHSCKNLTTAPELPATTLAIGCYAKMFHSCSGLTTAPELPATTLEYGCYNNMFGCCTNLTKAPELPATTLEVNCYSFMFYRCANLSKITMLATDVSALHSLLFWTSCIPMRGTFVKHPDMNSLPVGSNGIPEGWTVEDAVV